MYGIGAQLRAERLRRNLALDDIARETRISARYLEAIEKHDIVFGIGPAGTGKTYLAVAMANPSRTCMPDE